MPPTSKPDDAEAGHSPEPARTADPAMQPDAMVLGTANEPLAFSRDLGHLTEPAAAPSDMALAGGPVARRDGALVELNRYQQSGTIQIDGDTVTQQIGRGQTARYSRHGDSVKISVNDGLARVTEFDGAAAIQGYRESGL